MPRIKVVPAQIQSPGDPSVVPQIYPGRLISASLAGGGPTAGGAATMVYARTEVASGGALPGGIADADRTNSLVITSLTLPNATVGELYSFVLGVSGDIQDEVVWAIVGGILPLGLEFSLFGVLSGTPTESGGFTISVQAFCSGLGFSQVVTYNLTVAAGGAGPLTILTTAIPDGIEGQPFVFQFQASGGTGDYFWEMSSISLPNGVQWLLDGSGFLIGVPNPFGFFGEGSQGNWEMSIGLLDGVTFVSTVLTWHVQDAGQQIVFITPTNLPTTFIGDTYNLQLQIVGTTLAGTTFTITSGSLPGGLTLSSGGLISGSPTGGFGTFIFTVKATHAGAVDGFATFTLIFQANVSITGSGTVATGGRAEPAFVILKTASGGAVVGGSASVQFVAVPSAGIEITGSGTVDAAGDAPVNFASSIVASGAAEAGGSASVTGVNLGATGTAITASGGAVVFGIAGVVKGISWIAQGAARTTGSAEVVFVSAIQSLEVTAQGGADVAGDALVNFASSLTASGGAVVGGIVDVTVVFVPLQSLQITGSGVVSAGGTGGVLVATLRVASGGAVAGGSAAVSFGFVGLQSVQITGSGVVSAAGTAGITSVPSIGLPAVTAILTLRDGTVVNINQGDDYFYTAGLNPTNAPRGSIGLRIKCVVQDNDQVMLELKNSGRKWPHNWTLAKAGQPIYFKSLTVNAPGRMVPYGIKFRSVRQTGDDFVLVDPADPKHRMIAAVISADPTAYNPANTEHCIDGGLAIHYVFVPASDPIEQSHEPDATRRALANTFIDIAGDDLWIAYPYAKQLIEDFEDDGNQDNPALNVDPELTTEGWLMIPENIQEITSSHAAIEGPTGALKLKTWSSGLSVFVPGTGFNPNGHYGGNAWWMVRYLIDPTAPHAYEAMARGLNLTRQAVACSLHRCDVPCDFNKMWGTEGTLVDNFAAGYVYQRGQHGFPTCLPEKEWDIALMLAALLRPGDLMLQDAITARRSKILGLPITSSYTCLVSGTAGDLTTANQARKQANLLYNMMWHYRYYIAVGDTTNANLMKLQAEKLVLALYDAANRPINNPVPLWCVTTQFPALTPMDSGIGNSGHGEGMMHILTKWAWDVGVGSDTARNWIRDSVKWMLDNLTRLILGSSPPRRELVYRWWPDMTNVGGVFTMLNSTPVTLEFAGPHQSHIVNLEEWVEMWYPGQYTQHFTEFKNATYAHVYSSANSGAISSGPFGNDSFPKWHRVWTNHQLLRNVGG